MPDPTQTMSVPKHIFFFDHMRSRSHLFARWLSTHPDIALEPHPFLMAGFLGPERWTKESRNSERRNQENEVDMQFAYDGVDATYESDRVDFMNQVAEIDSRVRTEYFVLRAESIANSWQGKTLLSSDHWFLVLKQEILFDFIRRSDFRLSDIPANPTCFPDSFFSNMTPGILIRNPLYHIPSYWRDMTTMSQNRPGDEDWTITTTFAFLRLLFDLFHKQGRNVIVVDAEDILWRTDELAANLCQAFGVADSTKVTDRWEQRPRTGKFLNPVIATWTKVAFESEGVIRPAEKPVDRDLETEFAKWAEEYGEDNAKQMKELVEANMPHYEYLVQHKV